MNEPRAVATPLAETDDLVRRARAAYYREGYVGDPETTSGHVTELDGKRYVVLAGAHGVIAVYRVRTFDGVLRRMRRWPADVEARPATVQD
jgi:hypothetical protein